MPVLRIMSGPQSGESIPVSAAVVIGRSRSAGVHVDEKTLSRLHARLEPVGAEWRLTDLGSSNGSFVNGRPVRPSAMLHEGDVVRLGGLSFTFLPDPSGIPALNITVDAGSEGAPIIENVSVDEHIHQLLPTGIEKDDGELVVRRLRLLSEVAEVLSNVMDAGQLFPRALEKLLEVFPDAERGCVMTCDPDGGNLQPVAGLARPGAQSRMAVSRSLAREVVGSRGAVLSADVSGDGRFDPQHTVVRFGLRTVMCAPMICDNSVLGLIQLDSSNPDHRFTRADMALFLGIAGHTALALGKARLHDQLMAQVLLQKDLQMAERIQHSFLPRAAPRVDGYRFAQRYSAARHIGGDYYDFVQISDTALGIAVADVSGKGVAAALYMAKLSSEMRFHARGCLSACTVVAALNRALAEDMESGMFVTLALLILQPEMRNLTVCSAGHLPPLLCSAAGIVSELSSPGNIPIGVFEDARYSETEHLLQPGDRVLLYTDGVTEAMDRDGRLFGAERLKEVVRVASQAGPDDLLRAVHSAVTEHAAGVPQSDDLAMVCIAVDD